MWYLYTMEYYSALKRNEILSFAATWMDLEIILLSEVSQTEKGKYRMISLVCGILKKCRQMNSLIKQIDSETRKTNLRLPKGKREESGTNF